MNHTNQKSTNPKDENQAQDPHQCQSAEQTSRFQGEGRPSLSSQSSSTPSSGLHADCAPGSASSFAPDFAKGRGLIPVITQCSHSKEVLMLAYMNEEAYLKTLETGEAHYWSRSRNKLWHKGESSGHVQKIDAMKLDCDNDTLLLLVTQIGGAACHTGRESCFYRQLKNNEVTECSPMIFDPSEVYTR